MDKLKMHSPDLSQENIAKIRDLFPGCVTEARDEATGQLRLAVDFDQLRQELSDHIVEGPQERYRLDWPGKRAALVAANTLVVKTLRPDRIESVEFETTKNIFIEGDNLEVLKLLQKAYLGRIKAIYIDPPYNTGNDFIYNDNFVQNELIYEQESGQASSETTKLVANTEGNGRFHSDWLSMMMPRLKLARNLLRDDGILFISISDVEQANIRKLCEEIFGTENVIAQITWKARVKPVNVGEAKYRPQKEIEYVLVVQRSHAGGAFFPLHTGGQRSYPHENNGRKYRLTTILKSNRGASYRSTMSFSLGDYSPPDGQRWQAGEETIMQLHRDGYIEFRDGTPFRRYYEDEEGAEHDPLYCFMEVDWASTSEAGKTLLNGLMGEFHGFDTVKPVRLIKTLIQASTAHDQEHIILDFFGGSATTAHAVIEANSEDGGNRQFIINQIREPIARKFETRRVDYENVAELGKERIRRAGAKILEGECHSDWNRDVGFRVLKVDTSNMQDVYYRPDQIDQKDLLAAVDNIKPDRTPEDLLFQVLVDWGVDLTLPIQRETIQGKTVFFVDQNALVACFETDVTEELVKELAGREPLRVVFRDNGFVSDAVKINVEQVFRQLSPGTDVKSI